MYFDAAGPENTEETIAIAMREAMERKISHIIVASNTGRTAEILSEEAYKMGFEGQLVCVSHVNGFKEKGTNELSGETRRRLETQGVRVYTASHVLSGVERALSRSFSGTYPVEIIAHSLRMLGSGVKVVVEIAVMALDGGLIPYGNPVIAIGGTNSGADTAALLTPGHAQAIFETRIHEIFCKPRL
jgi:hypothetical protein